MALNLGDLDQALRALEGAMMDAQHVPTSMRFYFGGQAEEELRAKSPPYVAWVIQGGQKEEETREVSDDDRVHYLDDMVRVTARCAGLVPAGQTGPDPRRQQLAASMQVMLAVSWAVHSIHQGYCDDQGWIPVGPDGIGDAYYPIDYTFRIRAGRWQPKATLVQPETVEADIQVEVQ